MTGQSAPRKTEFCENFVPLPEFQKQVLKRFGFEPKRDTLYRWISQGLPSERRFGKRYFPEETAAQWIERTKCDGSLQIS